MANSNTTHHEIDVSAEICSRLDNVKGVLDLVYQAMGAVADKSNGLTAAWCALDLARTELELIADEVGGRLDFTAPRLMLVPAKEVANG